MPDEREADDLFAELDQALNDAAVQQSINVLSALKSEKLPGVDEVRAERNRQARREQQ